MDKGWTLGCGAYGTSARMRTVEGAVLLLLLLLLLLEVVKEKVGSGGGLVEEA